MIGACCHRSLGPRSRRCSGRSTRTLCAAVGRILAYGQPHPPAVFTPLQVIRAFWVPLFPTIDGDQIRLNSAVRRQDNWAVPHALASLDAFGEVYFLAMRVGHWRQPPIQLGISIGISSLQVPDDKSNGGERGIRTPDTRKGIHAFEARAFSHSAISPRRPVSFLFYQGSCSLRIFPPISLTEPGSPSHARSGCGLWPYSPSATPGSVIWACPARPAARFPSAGVHLQLAQKRRIRSAINALKRCLRSSSTPWHSSRTHPVRFCSATLLNACRAVRFSRIRKPQCYPWATAELSRIYAVCREFHPLRHRFSLLLLFLLGARGRPP